MSEALDAMVKAMIDELYRQSDPWIDANMDHPTDTFQDVARDVGIDGRIDLEKVARAGLAGLATSAEERDRIARVIFVKIDNTLYAPEHPSIQAAVEAILSGQGRPDTQPARNPGNP